MDFAEQQNRTKLHVTEHHIFWAVPRPRYQVDTELLELGRRPYGTAYRNDERRMECRIVKGFLKQHWIGSTGFQIAGVDLLALLEACKLDMPPNLGRNCVLVAFGHSTQQRRGP